MNIQISNTTVIITMVGETVMADRQIPAAGQAALIVINIGSGLKMVSQEGFSYKKI